MRNRNFVRVRTQPKYLRESSLTTLFPFSSARGAGRGRAARAGDPVIASNRRFGGPDHFRVAAGGSADGPSGRRLSADGQLSAADGADADRAAGC